VQERQKGGGEERERERERERETNQPNMDMHVGSNLTNNPAMFSW
jgi:hypothetical protein